MKCLTRCSQGTQKLDGIMKSYYHLKCIILLFSLRLVSFLITFLIYSIEHNAIELKWIVISYAKPLNDDERKNYYEGLTPLAPTRIRACLQNIQNAYKIY